MNVDLEFAGFVDRRIEQGKQTLFDPTISHFSFDTPNSRTTPRRPYLMRDIWTSVADVSVHLAHHTDVLVTVEQ